MMHSSTEGVERVPAFLYKLWKLVDSKDTNNLIHWSEAGNSFILCNQAAFSQQLLPLYYKHNNMASFVRQLNMYGFRKVPSIESGGLRVDRDEMEFAHCYFQRQHEDRLELIKRKLSSGRLGDNTAIGAAAGAATVTPAIVPDVCVSDLVGEIAALRQKQDSVSSELSMLRRENEEIWDRYASMQDKFNKQQNIINKLMRFIMSVMKPASLSRKLPQLSAHHNVPALTHGSRHSRSPLLCDGPVIHEVTDDNNTVLHDLNSSIVTTITNTHSNNNNTTINPTNMCSSNVASEAATTIANSPWHYTDFLGVDDGGGGGDGSGGGDCGGGSEDGGGNAAFLSELNPFSASPRGVILDALGNAVDEGVAVAAVPELTAGTSAIPLVESPKGTIISSNGKINTSYMTNFPDQKKLRMQQPIVSLSIPLPPSIKTTAASFPHSDVALDDFSLLASNAIDPNLVHTYKSVVPTTRQNTNMVTMKPKILNIVRKSFESDEQLVDNKMNIFAAPKSYTIGPNNILIPNYTTVSVINPTDSLNKTISSIKQELPPQNVKNERSIYKPFNATNNSVTFYKHSVGSGASTFGGKNNIIATSKTINNNSVSRNIIVNGISNRNSFTSNTVNNSGVNNLKSDTNNSGVRTSINNKINTATVTLNNSINRNSINNENDGRSNSAIVSRNSPINNINTNKRIISNKIMTSLSPSNFSTNNNSSIVPTSYTSVNNYAISNSGAVAVSHAPVGALNSGGGGGGSGSGSGGGGVKRRNNGTPTTDSALIPTAEALPVFKVVRKAPALPSVDTYRKSTDATPSTSTEIVPKDIISSSSRTSVEVVPVVEGVGGGGSGGQSMEDMQTMLDNLHDMVSSGRVQCDQATLFHNLFNPEFPLSDLDVFTDFSPSPADLTGSSGGGGGAGSSGGGGVTGGGDQQVSLYNSSLFDLVPLTSSPASARDDGVDSLLTTPRLSDSPLSGGQKRLKVNVTVKNDLDDDDEEDLLTPLIERISAQHY